MLESYKKSYEQLADNIPNWRTLSKSKLVNLYIENENNKELADSYLGAIICRYWNSINKNYRLSKLSASAEECYSWTVEGILRALKHRKWLCPTSSVYQDPNGPDKVINRCIKSNRLGFYQSSNTFNRRLNFGLSSIEDLQEQAGDVLLPSYEDKGIQMVNDMVSSIITKYFNKKEYFMAFMIDAIVNYDVFGDKKDPTNKGFNIRKLRHHMISINKSYIKLFASQYKLDLNESLIGLELCKKMTRNRIYNTIDRNLNLLKSNKDIKEYRGIL